MRAVRQALRWSAFARKAQPEQVSPRSLRIVRQALQWSVLLLDTRSLNGFRLGRCGLFDRRCGHPSLARCGVFLIHHRAASLADVRLVLPHASSDPRNIRDLRTAESIASAHLPRLGAESKARQSALASMVHARIQ